MAAIAYTVTATLPDQPTADEYILWLEDGHIDQVIEHGAHTAMIIRITEPASPIQIEVRYIFANRQAFDRYLKEAAPRLRAEGVRQFPPERSVRFDRRLGEIA